MTAGRRTYWITRRALPPAPSAVTPALRRMRARWYAQNPWTPDWDMVARCQKGAHTCFRERGL